MKSGIEEKDVRFTRKEWIAVSLMVVMLVFAMWFSKNANEVILNPRLEVFLIPIIIVIIGCFWWIFEILKRAMK